MGPEQVAAPISMRQPTAQQAMGLLILRTLTVMAMYTCRTAASTRPRNEIRNIALLDLLHSHGLLTHIPLLHNRTVKRAECQTLCHSKAQSHRYLPDRSRQTSRMMHQRRKPRRIRRPQTRLLDHTNSIHKAQRITAQTSPFTLSGISSKGKELSQTLKVKPRFLFFIKAYHSQSRQSSTSLKTPDPRHDHPSQMVRNHRSLHSMPHRVPAVAFTVF